MKGEKRLIVALGMHRSGTSAIIKGLGVLGVNLGSNFYPARPDNPKGDWEDKEFHSLNEELLRALNHPWDDLGRMDPKRVLELSQEIFLRRAVALINERLRRYALFGIKDPRFSLLLPFWKQAFAEAEVPVSFVVSLRNPLSVAESLARRDAFPKEKALRLWVMHNVCIVCETAAASPVVIDYDELLDNPTRELERVAHLLGLTVERTALAPYCSEFLDLALRHTRFSGDDIRADPDCDPIVLEIYEELRTQAVNSAPLDPARWEQLRYFWLTTIRSAPASLDFAVVQSSGQENASRSLHEK
jgi:hypothetical protein